MHLIGDGLGIVLKQIGFRHRRGGMQVHGIVELLSSASRATPTTYLKDDAHIVNDNDSKGIETSIIETITIQFRP
jgi:hypothetical protein